MIKMNRNVMANSSFSIKKRKGKEEKEITHITQAKYFVWNKK